MSEVSVNFTRYDKSRKYYEISICNEDVKFIRDSDNFVVFPKEVIIDFIKDKEEFIKALAMLGYYGD